MVEKSPSILSQTFEKRSSDSHKTFQLEQKEIQRELNKPLDYRQATIVQWVRENNESYSIEWGCRNGLKTICEIG